MRYQDRKEARRKAVSAYFQSAGRWHIEFVRELADRFKAWDNPCKWPYLPIRELAMCYSDSRNVEVAALAGVLLKDDRNRERRVREFRVMLGDSPFEWFMERRYIACSLGDRQEERTGGVLNWKISRYFDFIHDEYRGSFQDMAVLPLIIKDAAGAESYYYRYGLVKAVLSLADGFGAGVWPITPPCLRCPLSEPVLRFLRDFFPDYRRQMSADEAIGLFGLESDVDFFFACLGWEELCRRNPMACSRYVSVYQKRYAENNMPDSSYWIGDRGIVPKVEFT